MTDKEYFATSIAPCFYCNAVYRSEKELLEKMVANVNDSKLLLKNPAKDVIKQFLKKVEIYKGKKFTEKIEMTDWFEEKIANHDDIILTDYIEKYTLEECEIFKKVQRETYISDSFLWCEQHAEPCTLGIAKKMADNLANSFDDEISYWDNFKESYESFMPF